MNENIREELTPFLNAIEILSALSFRFEGNVVPVNSTSLQGMPGFPGHPLPSVPLVRELQSLLYARCYAHRFEEQPDSITSPPAMDAGFLWKLSQNNHSISRWEGGWTVYSIAPNGQVALVKGDRQRFALPGEFITFGPPGLPPQVGATVSVQVLNESAVAQPGFYFVYGETLSDVWDEYSLLRFYFHTSSSLAPALLDYLTRQLNRYQVAFRLKVLNDPALYGRTDAMVLYVARRYHALCVRIVRLLPEALAGQLYPSTPLFTFRLLPGVGLAEDPNTGESFGMSRCRLTAEGIVDAWTAGEQGVDARLLAIAARFLRDGLDLDRPHLSPASVEFPEILEQVEFAHA
jgi:hypothetical protein